MALTEEQRRAYLLARGLDPDQYDLQEVQKEAAPAAPLPAAEQSSALGSFGRAAGRGLIPSLGAAISGAGGYALGTALAPETGGLSLALPILGSLIAGGGGSILAEKGQEAALEKIAPTFKAQLDKQAAIDAEQHRFAQMAGGLASALPAFEFSPLSSIRGLSAAYRLGRGLVPEAEQAAAKAAAIGTGAQLGLGAATGVVNPLLEGRAPTLSDVGLGLGQAALLGRHRGYIGEVPGLGFMRHPLEPTMGRGMYEQPIGPAGPAEQPLGPETPMNIRIEQQLGMGNIPPNAADQQALLAAASKMAAPRSQTFYADPFGNVSLGDFGVHEVPGSGEVITGAAPPTGKVEARAEPVILGAGPSLDALQRQLDQVRALANNKQLPLHKRVEAQVALDEIQGKIDALSPKIAGVTKPLTPTMEPQGGGYTGTYPPTAIQLGTFQSRTPFPKGRTPAPVEPGKKYNVVPPEQLRSEFPKGKEPPKPQPPSTPEERAALQAELDAALGQEPTPPVATAAKSSASKEHIPVVQALNKGKENAPNTITPPIGNIPEHPGIPQGKNIPANVKEVRQEEGKLPSSGGSLQRGTPGQITKGVRTPEQRAAEVAALEKQPLSPFVGTKEGVKEVSAAKAAVEQSVNERLNAMLAKKASPTVTVKKGKNFSVEGNWVVHIGDKQFEIFRDPESTNWYETSKIGSLPHEGLLSVSTKQDAINALIKKYGLGSDPNIKFQEATKLAEQLTPGELLAHPVNADILAATEKIAERHNITLKSTDETIISDKQKISAGSADLAQRLAKFNGNLATVDTGLHEIGHIFLDDLRTSLDPKERALYDRGVEAVRGDEERLVEAVGLRSTDLLKARIEGNELNRVLHWLRDFWAKVKEKFGQGNEKDLINLMARRMVDGEMVARGERPTLDESDNIRYSAARLKNPMPPVEDYRAQQDMAYGHWISPEGTMHRVGGMSGGHEKNAVQILKSLVEQGKISKKDYDRLNIPFNSTSELEGMLFNRGWARGVHEGDNKYYAEYSKPLSNAQIRALKDYGIERDAAIHSHERDRLHRGTQVLYDRPDNIRYQEARTQEAADTLRSHDFSIPLLRSIMENVRRIPVYGEHLYKAFNGFYDVRDEMLGKYRNQANLIMSKLDPWQKQIGNVLRGRVQAPNADAIAARLFAERENPAHVPEPMEPHVEEAYHQVKDLLEAAAQEANERGIRVMDGDDFREIIINRRYIPHMMSEQASYIIRNKQGTPEYNAMHDDFINWMTHGGLKGPTAGVSEDAAEGMWKERTKPVTMERQTGGYGPLEFAAGMGLPPSMREQHLSNILNRYFDRYAEKIAWFENVEKDTPENAVTRALLDKTDQFGNKDANATTMPDGTPLQNLSGKDEIKHAEKDMLRNYDRADRLVEGFNRVVKAGMMQTLTGFADFTGGIANSAQHLALKDYVTLMPKAVSNLAAGIRAGLRWNVVQQHAARLQGGSIEGGNPEMGARMDNIVKQANNVADLIYRITGRDSFERWGRGLLMNLGMLKTEAVIGKIRSSTATASDYRWMDTFMERGKWEHLLAEGRDGITTDLQERIAAKFVQSVQGTYDARGLPAWALSGQLAPFFALARWNIEKANNFTKYVINPMKRGDFAPFLKMTGMAILGGEAIHLFRQMVTDRKPQDANWSEIMAAGGAGLDYRLLASMAFSGYSGALADILKQSYDVLKGNQAQGFRFPIIASIQGFANRGSQFAQAVEEGENPIALLPQLALTLGKDNIQMARALTRYASEDEAKDIERSNALRDLRVFRQETGIPVPPMLGQQANPFLNPLKKQYQREAIPQQAATIAPQLIQQAIARAAGDPERLQALLRNYAAASSDVFPSSTRTPIQFKHYLDWLTATQGERAAKAAVTGYFQKQSMDQMKRSLIPSL